MTQEKQLDIIIIGTGVGGGTLAYGWHPAGRRSICLNG
jgi:choline dehydrogenase-like flavoprotein